MDVSPPSGPRSSDGVLVIRAVATGEGQHLFRISAVADPGESPANSAPPASFTATDPDEVVTRVRAWLDSLTQRPD